MRKVRGLAGRQGDSGWATSSLEVTGPASSGAELLINFPLERGTPSFCIFVCKEKPGLSGFPA